MVENMGDDLWVGVICQTNLEIACSLRNSFRASVACLVQGVEHWMGDGPHKVTDLSQTPNAITLECSSETTGDELRGRKGNSPDRRLRPQILD